MGSTRYRFVSYMGDDTTMNDTLSIDCLSFGARESACVRIGRIGDIVVIESVQWFTLLAAT